MLRSYREVRRFNIVFSTALQGGKMQSTELIIFWNFLLYNVNVIRHHFKRSTLMTSMWVGTWKEKIKKISRNECSVLLYMDDFDSSTVTMTALAVSKP